MKETIICLIVVAALSMCGLAQADTSWRYFESNQNQTLQKHVQTSPIAAGEPFTLSTKVRFGEINDSIFGNGSAQPPEIWLAGVASTSGVKPTALALSLMLDTSSWFPTWRLCIKSDAGLLPTGEKTLRLEASISPQSGHEYDTVLSYDPRTGFLSVRVSEQPGNQVLYAGNIELNKHSGVLYPGAGSQDSAEKPQFKFEVTQLAVKPYYVPVGVRGQLVTRNKSDEMFIAMRTFDRRNEWALDLSLPAQPLENELRLVRDDGVSQTLCLTIKSGPQTIPIDGTNMPAGKADYILEYVVNGDKWEISRVPLQVGTVDVRLESLSLGVASNGEPEVTGLVKVASDGLIPPFNLNLDYELSTPGIAAPLYEQWKTNNGKLSLQIENVTAVATNFPVHIPLGRLTDGLKTAGSSSGLLDTQIFAKVAMSTGADLAVTIGGLQRAVLGKRAPAFPMVGEYTVLRGDFHSHSTESDGELSPSDRMWESYMYGYDILALTDHRNINGYNSAEAYAEAIGLNLVRGFETGIESKQHLIVLGTDNGYQMRDEHSWARQPNTARVYYQDQVREVINHGGYIIYAHPGGEWIPPGPFKHPDGQYGLTDEILWMFEQGYVHGVETRGSLEAGRRDAPFRWALERDLTLFDVTDVHGLRNFTKANQSPLTLVLAKENTPASVLEALWNKRTLIWRNGLLRGMDTWLQPFINANLDFKLTERNGAPSLQITNIGSLGLYGTIQVDGGKGQFSVLSPNRSIYIPCDKDVDTVTIAWGNVQDEPGKALVTQHIMPF